MARIDYEDDDTDDLNDDAPPAWRRRAVTAVLAVAAWRPRRSLGLALRLWSGWKLLQRVRTVGSTATRLF